MLNKEGTMTRTMLSKVLEDVNNIRLAIGIGQGDLPELPKGRRRHPNQCVLARALSNGWEAEVDSDIRLSHPIPFDKPFNWEKAADTLVHLGFDAYLDDDEGYSDDEYFWQIVIQPTIEMETLIMEFDEGLLPFLVLED